jgi:FAD/FMN-containing dehydrogenase
MSPNVKMNAKPLSDPAYEVFCSIVGAAHVLVIDDDKIRYECDGRANRGSAAAVVRPESTAQVSSLLASGADYGITFVPQSGNTGLVGSGIANESGDHVVLSLDRLNGVMNFDPANRSVRVSAGVRLSELNAAAAVYGLTFPIDLGADPAIGGMIATNTGGARFLRYGDVRRNVMAVEVVLADGHGSVVNLGRDLWKDNSFLDLKNLFVGSSGSLGVVTAATLALQPMNTTRTTAMLAFHNTHQIAPLLLELEKHFGALLSAFEGISASAMNAALDHIPRLRRPFADTPLYTVLVELAGGAALNADWLEEQLAHILSDSIADGTITDVVTDRRNDLWAIRHALPEGLRAKGSVIACDISLPRGQVFEFRDQMIAAIGSRWPDLELCDFGHIGDGGLHFNLVSQKEPPAEVKSFIFTQTVKAGGSFSAEHGIGPNNINAYHQHTDFNGLQLAGRVQRTVAPQRIGRVDFGPRSGSNNFVSVQC